MTPDAASAAPLLWQQAVIERIEARTRRVTSIFLRVDSGAHEAGQHLDVRLTAPDGYQAQRSYSIASMPGSALVELAIEGLDDGEVSPYFHDIARAGDTIEVRGPIGGHFIWRVEDGGPLLLVGGGSGVVPLMAIARHRAASSPRTSALLLYSSRTWEDVVFRDELLGLESLNNHFKLVITTTRGEAHRNGDFIRRVDRSLLRTAITAWGHAPRRVYVCGSNVFVESVTSALVAEGIAAGEIRTERFGGAS